MLARPRTILPATRYLLVLCALVLGCGGDDSADQANAEAVTETTTETAIETTASSIEPAEVDNTDADGQTTGEELFPDVIDASARQDGDGTWTVSATLSSPYDSAERYADGWRVVGQDGTVYGIRVLTHDHADEQPFTRSHDGIEIPDDVDVVMVEGRDQLSGWGGETFQLELPR